MQLFLVSLAAAGKSSGATEPSDRAATESKGSSSMDFDLYLCLLYTSDAADDPRFALINSANKKLVGTQVTVAYPLAKKHH